MPEWVWAGRDLAGKGSEKEGWCCLEKKITAEAVLRELAAIGFARAPDFLQVRDGTLEIRDLDAGVPMAAAVAAVERTSTGLKLKFYDKLRALELLGKCTGLFEPDTCPDTSRSTLLQAILRSTSGEVRLDDLPELQQAAAAGDDLVEPSGTQSV